AGPVPPVPLQQPQNLFRFGEQTIWSTSCLQQNALASTTQRLFTVPIGSTGQGFTNALSIAETNLKEGGRVPSGVAYDVFGVSTEVALCDAQGDAAGIACNQPMDTAADITQLLNVIHNGVLSWDFTQTQVDIAPVVLCGAGGGAFGAVAQNAAGANSGHMNNGNGSIWMYRKHPVALPGNSTFSVVIRFGSRAATNAALNTLNLRVTLLGYYKNVIEIG
ncbi:MAG: hypothetical protein KAJ42_09340, partial [Gemmatimonadetes bacterium]|nr:hypothetical protein [Gemmatimonadota bacterium]